MDLIPRVPLPCMSLSPPPAGPLASASTLQDSGGLEDIWGVPSGDLGLYSRKQVPYSLGLSVPVNSVMSEAPTRSDISDPLNSWATGSGSWCPGAGLGQGMGALLGAEAAVFLRPGEQSRTKGRTFLRDRDPDRRLLGPHPDPCLEGNGFLRC